MADDVLFPSQQIGLGGISINQIPPKSAEEHESLTIVPSHPLRIKPAGNAYTATENIKLAAGSFTALPDELLIQVLESLDADSLNRLGCACKSLYAFSRLEDLWKKFCIEYETSPTPFWYFVELLRCVCFAFAVVWSILPAQESAYSGCGLLVSRKCIYRKISMMFSNICYELDICISKDPKFNALSISRDIRMLRGHLLGLPRPLLSGVEHGGLPILSCLKPIALRFPARTYSLMSSIGPSSALTLRWFLTRPTYQLAMRSLG